MKSSILSDAVESLIGAIFIDGGYKTSYNFVKKFWSPYLDVDLTKTVDPKTTLQEISQQKAKNCQIISLLKGRAITCSVFTIALKVLDLNKITAKGHQ